MTMLSKNTRLRFTLNNQPVDAPIEWEDISIEADFESNAIQPTIDIEAFTFVNKEAQSIRDWIDSGRIFEGIPFKIDAYNINTAKNSFDGYINCADGVELFEDKTLKAKITQARGLTNLREKMQGTTMSYLEAIGVFTQSDYTKVKYVVEKSDNTLEVLINTVVGYMLIVQLQQQIKELADNVGKFADATTPIPVVGVPPGVAINVGGLVYAALCLVIQIAYTIFVLAATINLGIKMFETFLPIPRTHRTLKLRTALENISGYLGYTFSSPIELLDKLVYLPSNLETDDVNLLTGLIRIPKGTRSGVPNERDFGFTALEMFELCERMFNAQIKINGNILEFRSRNDPYWEQASTSQMPNFLRQSKRYNTDELIFSRLLRFQTDEIADECTINNFKGTNYEIITNDRTIANQEAKFITKHETIDFPVCLGNRKNELNPLENALAIFGGIIDSIINFFGGNSNLSGKITSRIGVLKVGTNNTTKPKLLYVNGTKLPFNHRELFSAKVLYNLYINEKSFVLNNYGGQKALYSLEGLPFGFEDFLNTIENSNFVDSDNNRAKFRTLNWLLAGDTASGEIEQKEIYTTSLTETYIEAE
tara:strand:- start:574 stop:2352 length:1779 start_codon:yes stop_codon:yes gene_type:complete